MHIRGHIWVKAIILIIVQATRELNSLGWLAIIVNHVSISLTMFSSNEYFNTISYSIGTIHHLLTLTIINNLNLPNSQITFSYLERSIRPNFWLFFLFCWYFYYFCFLLYLLYFLLCSHCFLFIFYRSALCLFWNIISLLFTVWYYLFISINFRFLFLKWLI